MPENKIPQLQPAFLYHLSMTNISCKSIFSTIQCSAVAGLCLWHRGHAYSRAACHLSSRMCQQCFYCSRVGVSLLYRMWHTTPYLSTWDDTGMVHCPVLLLGATPSAAGIACGLHAWLTLELAYDHSGNAHLIIKTTRLDIFRLLHKYIFRLLHILYYGPPLVLCDFYPSETEPLNSVRSLPLLCQLCLLYTRDTVFLLNIFKYIFTDWCRTFVCAAVLFWLCY